MYAARSTRLVPPSNGCMPSGPLAYNFRYPVTNGLLGCFPLTPATGGSNIAGTSTIADKNDERFPPFVATARGPAMFFNGETGSNAFTVETGFLMAPTISLTAWITVSTTTGHRAIFGGRSTGSIEFSQDSSLQMLISNSGNPTVATSVASIPASGVSFVGFSWNSVSGAWAFYINGKQDSTGTQTESINIANNWGMIGASLGPFSPGDPWQGTISNVNIYNRVLTQDEFFILFSRPFGMLNPTNGMMGINMASPAFNLASISRFQQIQIWDH